MNGGQSARITVNNYCSSPVIIESLESLGGAGLSGGFESSFPQYPIYPQPGFGFPQQQFPFNSGFGQQPF